MFYLLKKMSGDIAALKKKSKFYLVYLCVSQTLRISASFSLKDNS